MIVFDSSTLILTAKVELLEMFLDGSGFAAAVPGEVARERCSAKETLDAAFIRKVLDSGRIEVAGVKNRRLIAKLRADFSLGKGEAEAVALAVERAARLVAIDDKNGINACKVIGIAFTTAIAVLVRCCEKRLLEHGEALGKLAQLARYGRYTQAIIDAARQRLEAMA